MWPDLLTLSLLVYCGLLLVVFPLLAWVVKGGR